MSDANSLPEPVQDASSSQASQAASSPDRPAPAAGGPINLDAIRRLRENQQGAAPPRQGAAPSRAEKRGPKRDVASTPGSTPKAESESLPSELPPEAIDAEAAAPRYKSNKDQSAPIAPKVPVPSARVRFSDEDAALEDALSGANLDQLMIGDKTVQVGRRLEDGSRHPGKVLKVHNANVFVSLGGPDQGVVNLLQFDEPPVEGQPVDVLIRSFNNEEGLYELSMPGETISVNDWDDLTEGGVVEAKVESANTGGVECKVGNVRGFIPMSQLSEFRVESAADFVGQKLLCVITEANPRRGNLVLSHRAVLERDKEAKRKERLATIQVGDHCDGTVRKVLEFGAFVDIGGLDGLIHVTQLSWEKIKHPSEVVKEGDQIKVRIDKIDPVTGKIGLSYRSAQDNPWNDVETRFPPGSVVRGAVSRLANFGAFVKLATGIEGLIHISELAHRRVASVSQVLQEGQEVEVKVLTVEPDTQRIALSLRATQAKPEKESGGKTPEPEIEDVRRAPAVKKFDGPLKGGTGKNNGGELFGLKF
ncbi:S1 RNA-binding domain-containing protein [Pirellulaceae bacterium SH467]|jgi:small subunit ribosomal protein S1